MVIDACLKPKVSRMTLTIGTRQLVVHDAFETIVCLAESYLSLLTPMTMVMSSSFAGAEINTFFAPAGDVLARGAGLGKTTRRFEDDVDAEVFPRESRRGLSRRGP